jgi:hypothetical protein
MKNLNFTKKYTDRKTTNSNNCEKFDVNWPRGSQFTVRHTKNRLQWIWWIKSHNSEMKNWNFTKKYTDHKTNNSNTYAKFEVNWPRGFQFTKKYTDRKTVNSNNCTKFEVNWPRGSQFTARHMKNRLQFDE